MGFVALSAAFLAPAVWRRVILYRTPVSWAELKSERGRVTNFAHYLVGVLEQFDTVDLCRGLQPGKGVWASGTDASGRVLAELEVYEVVVVE